MSGLIGNEVEIPLPDGVRIFSHQVENVKFLLERKVALIADAPGCGKTLSTIATINCFLPKRVLIICPASLKLNWRNEWNKFSIHSHMSIGIVTTKTFELGDVTIINYDLLSKYHAELIKHAWDFLVLDEAHYAKNPQADRTKRIFGAKAKRKPIAAIPRKRLIMLTGTPMTSRPIDLWQFCQIADPQGLGKDYFNFVKRYCAAWSSPWGLDVSGASNLEELGAKLRASFMIRHDKDILGLPPKIRQVIELPTDGLGVKALLEKERNLYESLQRDGVHFDVEDFEDQVEKLAKQKGPEKVRMMTDLAATRQEVALKKLPMALAFIDNLIDQDEKVVVFSYHRAISQAIQDHYGEKSVMINGSVGEKARQSAVEAFQGDPAVVVMNGQIKAAGVGLTLTASRTTVFVEIDYVPANLEQAEDRVHRISQNRTVNTYYLVLSGSLDATIAQKVVEKQANINKVMKE